jgi:hypothetical protein
VILAHTMRACRGLWPNRNPLRRTLDRVEAAVVGGLVIAFLAGAPTAALAAGHIASSISSRTAHAEQAAWHRVPARLLLAATPAAGYHYDQVPAWWASPDGAWHVDFVSAPSGTSAGGTVMVWVDAAGRLTGPPLQPRQIWVRTILAAALAPVVLGFILVCVGWVAYRVLDRRRLAAWAAEWRATGPQWTGRP